MCLLSVIRLSAAHIPSSPVQLSVICSLRRSHGHLLHLFFLNLSIHALVPAFPPETSPQLCCSLFVTEGGSNEFLPPIRPALGLVLRGGAAADGETIHQVGDISCNCETPRRDLGTHLTNMASNLNISHSQRLQNRSARQLHAVALQEHGDVD